MESIKIHLASLNPSDRYDVDNKAEYLHNIWLQMKEKVLKRVDLVSLLIDFYQRAQSLSEMFDLLQKELINTPEEGRLKIIESSWIQIQNHYDHVKMLGHKYLNTIRVSIRYATQCMFAFVRLKHTFRLSLNQRTKIFKFRLFACH